MRKSMNTAWMILSDVCNHIVAIKIISTLTRKHSYMYLNVSSFYFPCLIEDLPHYKEVESKKTSSALYVDFFTCTKLFPCFKVFPCPMLAPSSRRYKVNPKQWFELSYEVSRRELRMETYLIFFIDIRCSEGVVINFFGRLKHIVAALVSSLQHTLVFSLFVCFVFSLMCCSCVHMNDFNVFSYIDSTFMHMLDEKIAYIRPLRQWTSMNKSQILLNMREINNFILTNIHPPPPSCWYVCVPLKSMFFCFPLVAH